MLATIVCHAGATPFRSGSKMIVTADGRGIGTMDMIWGGQAELLLDCVFPKAMNRTVFD